MRDGGAEVDLEEARVAGTAFLVSPLESEDDARAFLERNARALFEHELGMWVDDPSRWPAPRDV